MWTNDVSPFARLKQLWIEKINSAIEHKKIQFQDDANTAVKFYRGPHDFMYNQEIAGNQIPRPAFLMTCNRVADMVQLFGPTLYHRNPNVKVTSKPIFSLPPEFYPAPQVFQAQQFELQKTSQLDGLRSQILETYLNWAPNSLNLRQHARDAVDEALIKGMGVLWFEVRRLPGASFEQTGMFFDTIDNLVIDPDMESLDDAHWIARRCVHPTWWVEKEYGLEPGSLRGFGNHESIGAQIDADMDEADQRSRAQGKTSDLITYWKIYSKMGMGGRLAEGSNVAGVGALDSVFGDNVFLAVAENVPYFLNLPPKLTSARGANLPNSPVVNQLVSAVSWPVPFWAMGEWPMATLAFHKVPRQVWPMSHLKPGLGELKFLNWAYSFLAAKMRNTCRDFVAVLKEASEEFKTAVLRGQDLTMLELEIQGKRIEDVVQFLQHPQVNGDIWRVIEAVERQFERRVGLNELLYAGDTGKQIRSAQEAQVKQQNMSIRPDDMAEQVEAWMSRAMKLQAMGSRYLLQGQDVLPVLGQQGAWFWDQFVHTSDPQAAAHQLEYRIEAGSIRKPNRERDQENATQAMQVLMPILNQYAQATGQIGPVNALIAAWCESMDLPPERFLLPVPPPPPPPPGAPGGEGGGPPPGK